MLGPWSYRLNCWCTDVIGLTRLIHPCWITPDPIRGEIRENHSCRFPAVLRAKYLDCFSNVSIDRCLGDTELARDLF